MTETEGQTATDRCTHCVRLGESQTEDRCNGVGNSGRGKKSGATVDRSEPTSRSTLLLNDVMGTVWGRGRERERERERGRGTKRARE